MTAPGEGTLVRWTLFGEGSVSKMFWEAGVGATVFQHGDPVGEIVELIYQGGTLEVAVRFEPVPVSLDEKFTVEMEESGDTVEGCEPLTMVEDDP